MKYGMEIKNRFVAALLNGKKKESACRRIP
jgi:hypothetical protein